MVAIIDNIAAIQHGSGVSTETPISVKDDTGQRTTILGLLDTGASNAYIKQSALANVKHTIKKANISVTGQYSTVNIKEQATFKIKLPAFGMNRTVIVRASVKEATAGRHNLILGTKVLANMGMIMDFGSNSMTWLGATRLMQPPTTNTPTLLSTLEASLPFEAKHAIKRIDHKTFSSNKYSAYNYTAMVNKCKHLLLSQKKALLNLFSCFKELFSGKLGCIRSKAVNIKLKPGIRPFHAPAYSIPASIYNLCCKEINNLVSIEVLESIRHSKWAAPCLFCRKKDGNIQFLTDFRRLNKAIEQSPSHLPLLEDVLHCVAGFQYATCLDLNRGYYHFPLSCPARCICIVVLPWGKYAYSCLPQGLMISSNIFQAKLDAMFIDFPNVIVYIDNIIVFTKGTFKYHLKCLGLVLQILAQNNMHVHVKETFLAANWVDYLGYTITRKGILPQTKKIDDLL